MRAAPEWRSSRDPSTRMQNAASRWVPIALLAPGVLEYHNTRFSSMCFFETAAVWDVASAVRVFFMKGALDLLKPVPGHNLAPRKVHHGVGEELNDAIVACLLKACESQGHP